MRRRLLVLMFWGLLSLMLGLLSVMLWHPVPPTLPPTPGWRLRKI